MSAQYGISAQTYGMCETFEVVELYLKLFLLGPKEFIKKKKLKEDKMKFFCELQSYQEKNLLL